jgi:hypothetical protein
MTEACTVNWTSTTHDRYWEFLGAVPPAHQGNGGFLVGEPHDFRMCEIQGRMRATYRAFLEQGDGRYWEAGRPLTRAEFLNSNRPPMTTLADMTKAELNRLYWLARASKTAFDLDWRPMHNRLCELGVTELEADGRYCPTHHGLKLLAEHMLKA